MWRENRGFSRLLYIKDKVLILIRETLSRLRDAIDRKDDVNRI